MRNYDDDEDLLEMSQKNKGSKFREKFSEEQLLVKFSGSQRYDRHGWGMWIIWVVGAWV
jgi:hypothetical protein